MSFFQVHRKYLGVKSSDVWDLLPMVCGGGGAVNVAARGAGLAMSWWLLGLGYRLMGGIKSKSKREEV